MTDMYYFCRALVYIGLKIAYNLKFVGRENIPKKTPMIYCPNHRSYLDPPVVALGARGKMAFMAKESLFRNKLFCWLISSLGAFPVSRGSGDLSVLDKSAEKIAEGKSLMIFPEGTRSKDGKVGKGHSGAAVISAKSGAAIVPVGVIYGEKLRFRSRVVVKFGKPIPAEEYFTQIGGEPDPRSLVKMKKRYMSEIKALVEGDEVKNEQS